jgi:adenylate cyclase
MRFERIRVALFLVVAAVSILLTAAVYLAPSAKPLEGAFQSTADLERKSIDARFKIRGTRTAAPDIAIVAIDDQSFNDLQYRWPFPRAYTAGVINRLHEDGAKVIIVDIQFTEPSPFGSEDDDALITACRRAHTCVLATTEVDDSGKRAKTSVFGGEEAQAYAHARVGNGNVSQDPDGTTRKLAVVAQKLKALSVVAFERATGKPVDPASAGGKRAYIDFAGPIGTYKRFSFSHVCGCAETKPAPGFKNARVDKAPPQVATGYFRNKVVIVGPWAPVLQDIHPTPVDGSNPEMPGSEIQANAFQTVREGFPLQDSPSGLDLLLIALLGLVAPLASIRLRLWGIWLALGVAAAYTLVAQFAFNNGLLLSFTYPIGALILASVGSLAVHYVTEAFERARTRENFARFVPESVVDQVLEQADGARLGGVGRHATVMFSDLRGFTSFAEQLEPDQVIRILNRYLTAMVDEAIIPNGGTLVDYMGDGIMAVFGAPIEMPDHADRALAAARAKLQRLEEFNTWMQAEFGFDKSFRMGIGLNSGLVMSGNVGSETRLAYTAIGDTTNTAARLEGMTKGTDLMLFMAQSTKEALSTEPADIAFVGEYEIRGRVERLPIWSVEQSRKEKEEGGSFASVAETETLADK